MKVGIGADHGGFEMKQQLAKLLAEGKSKVSDLNDRREQ
jgi:ribose 5-phosphate isomerase RpiB